MYSSGVFRILQKGEAKGVGQGGGQGGLSLVNH